MKPLHFIIAVYIALMAGAATGTVLGFLVIKLKVLGIL